MAKGKVKRTETTSSGSKSKRRERLGVKKSSNFNEGVHPVTGKEFVICKWNMTEGGWKLKAFKSFQTRIGAVKARLLGQCIIPRNRLKEVEGGFIRVG